MAKKKDMKQFRIIIIDNYKAGGSSWHSFTLKEQIEIWGGKEMLPEFVKKWYGVQ